MVTDSLSEKADPTEAMPSGQSNRIQASQTNADPSNIQDGFLLIEGGTFLMGSPESENWRIEDEFQHEVIVSSFYVDPHETTQEEYERLMGNNPSTFSGEKLPVENISWLDAVNFANAKSIEAGLTPTYTVTSEGVSWDMSADGYRLPTEAEWEYACRAGTTTPFNTEKSLDAAEANFYGHDPGLWMRKPGDDKKKQISRRGISARKEFVEYKFHNDKLFKI
ncbi:MAG: formylglycine-generating enzyme family protein [Lachnospiraceae bacterium]|nr:formylglycine-generating enzyme family protein [Lachnospiraceae bacterium]